MNPWIRLACLAVLWPSLSACEEKKDLSPPPLNPHPKEALHIRVTFDHPEDAQRYSVTMHALYQNQQRECGYIASPLTIGNFVYPHDTFDIPNESREPGHADFTVYLDRYNRETCNWELAAPDVRIHDNATGRIALGHWGLREEMGGLRGEMTPGSTFKAVCLFRPDEFPQTCYGRRPMPPDIPHYSLVPITIHVSPDSAPLRPCPPSYFSHFLSPMNPSDAPSPSSDDDGY
jgi:hypothetical protein